MLWNSLDKMVDVSRKTYGKNGVETIADNDEIQWLNEKNIEEGLNRKTLWATTLKYIFQIIENIDMNQQMNQKTTQQNFDTQRISNQSNYGLQNNSST